VKMVSLRKVMCLLAAMLMMVSAACAAELEGGLIGVNDVGFTCFGLDMGDRSLTQDEILHSLADAAGAEPVQIGPTQWIISNYDPQPDCLGARAAMSTFLFEEYNSNLYWVADTLLLPEKDTAVEDFYSYETSNRLFENAMEQLEEIYGKPDEVSLCYWDAAEQDMVTFTLVSADFFSTVWSMVEQSEYGYLAARYCNAAVRLEREVREGEAFNTCWLNLSAYDE